MFITDSSEKLEPVYVCHLCPMIDRFLKPLHFSAAWLIINIKQRLFYQDPVIKPSFPTRQTDQHMDAKLSLKKKKKSSYDVSKFHQAIWATKYGLSSSIMPHNREEITHFSGRDKGSSVLALDSAARPCVLTRCRPGHGENKSSTSTINSAFPRATVGCCHVIFVLYNMSYVSFVLVNSREDQITRNRTL